MGRRGRIEVPIGVDAAGFYKGISGIEKRLAALVVMWGGMRGMGGLIKRGVEFNQTLETAQVGIAAILRQFKPERFASTAAAMGKAGQIMGEIKEQAMLTVDTIRDLTMAYKNLSGVMFQANVPVEKQVKLLVLMSQAVRGMGLGARGQQMFQLIEETRAILTGQVTRYSIVAQQLIAKAPGGIEGLRTSIKEGRVYEFIAKEMMGFKEAGDLLNKTLEGSISNLNDIIDAMTGTSAQGLYDEIKKQVIVFQDLFKDPEFTAALKEVIDLMARFVKVSLPAFVGAIKGMVKNREAILWFAGLGAGLLGVFKFLNVLTKIGKWMVSLGPVLGRMWGWLSYPKVLGKVGGTGFNQIAYANAGMALKTAGRSAGGATAGWDVIRTGKAMQGAIEAGTAWDQARLDYNYTQNQIRYRQRELNWKNKRSNELMGKAGYAGTGGHQAYIGFREEEKLRKVERDQTKEALYSLLPQFRSVLTDQDRLSSLQAQLRALEYKGIRADNVGEWFSTTNAIDKLKRERGKGFFGGVFGGMMNQMGGNQYTKRGLFTSRGQASYQKSAMGILEESAGYLKDIYDEMVTQRDPLAPI